MTPFKTYFAGVQCPEADEYINEKGLHRLLSYWNDKRIFKQRVEAGLKTFLDSGAFTAWTKGTVVDVDEYIEFVNKYDKGLEYFMQVDAIPGKRGYEPTAEERRLANEETWQNFLYMHKRVKSPHKLVPVFHVGSNLQLLHKMLDFRPKIEVLALGNTVGRTQVEKAAKIGAAFEEIKRSSYPDIKVHVLGVQDFNIIEKFPMYSADASSWIMASANGAIMTDFGPVLVSEKSTEKKTHFVNLSKPVQDRILEYIDRYGFNMKELSKEYKKRTLFNIKWLEERSKQYECKHHESLKQRQETLF